MPRLEIACFKASSAIRAHAKYVNRIELCADQSLGGVSPLLTDLQVVKNWPVGHRPVTVNVMIRPRGGDFIYTFSEFCAMQREIEEFGAMGADGFVFGILTPEGKVDAVRCKELIGKAREKPCTFHRAFDEIPAESMLEQLEVLIELGFKSVLTSGCRKNAMEGRQSLKTLVDAAQGRIDVIVGGGVRSGNIELLRRETGAEWFHSSAVTGEGQDIDDEEVGKLKDLLCVEPWSPYLKENQM